MSSVTIQDIMFSLPKRYKVEKAPQYETIFHFVFEEIQFTVNIKAGKCHVEEGLIGEPKCLVRTKAQTYVDLTMGKGNPQMAVMMGKVKVSNIPEMMQFAPLFAKFDPEKITNPSIENTTESTHTQDRKPTQGPLKGLRVIDMSRLLPGPLGAMLMADMGAEVIKVEAPKFKDYARDFPPYIGKEAAAYLAFNRSKRSLVLDYSQPEGKEILIDLIKTADILIEQYRPGVMKKMGLDYETLAQINPKLIYVSITGYGQTGPYSQLAGHDLNYITYSGLLAGNQHTAPQMPLAQIADIAGGSYMAVIGCLSALYARQQTGKGQWVDVAMMDGAMPLAINTMMYYWATQQPLAREESLLSGGLINYNLYACQDGKYVALGTLEPKFWGQFCEVVQKPEWKSRMIATTPEQKKLFTEEIQALFKTQPQAYWVALGLKHDLLINAVYETAEIENDPHVQARKMVVETVHPTLGAIKGVGVPLKFSNTEAQPAWAAPAFGEDTEALLNELGIDEARRKALREKQIL